MTYEEFIQDILDSRPNEKIKDVYMEHHHIKPRCLGGEDVEENMIWLLPEEHYKAHELLALENPDNHKLNSAWFLMCHLKGKGQERYEVSAEEYAKAKRAYSKSCSERFSGKGNPNYGGGNMSEEGKRNISEANKKRLAIHNPSSDKTTKEKLSKIKKEWWKNHEMSEEERRNRSLAAQKNMCKRYNYENCEKYLYCVELNKIYYSSGQAAEELSVTSTCHIREAARGIRETAYGYHWKYVEGDDLIADSDRTNESSV